MKPVLALVLFVALFPTVSRAQPAPVDLGTLGGNYSSAVAVNDGGQVAGISYAPPGDVTVHAFIWSRAAGMVDLGTLGSDTYVSALNARGQAAGHSYPAGSPIAHAVLWTPEDGLVDLGTLGGRSTRAVALNDNGQVIGYSVFLNRLFRAFSWTASGGMQDLGGLSAADADIWRRRGFVSARQM